MALSLVLQPIDDNLEVGVVNLKKKFLVHHIQRVVDGVSQFDSVHQTQLLESFCALCIFDPHLSILELDAVRV